MSFVRIWKFRAAPGRTAEFVSAYSGEGDWAQLFRRGEGYLGTELLQPHEAGGFHVTVDRWRSERDWLLFLDQHGDAYRALDRRLAGLCSDEEEIGAFTTAS